VSILSHIGDGRILSHSQIPALQCDGGPAKVSIGSSAVDGHVMQINPHHPSVALRRQAEQEVHIDCSEEHRRQQQDVQQIDDQRQQLNLGCNATRSLGQLVRQAALVHNSGSFDIVVMR
jgi:hypothetical protein